MSVEQINPKAVGRPSKYPYEFRRMIAEKAISEHYTFKEIAQQYNISQGCINVWKKMYLRGDLEKMNAPRTARTSEAVSKVVQLERENKDLKQELGDLYLQVCMLKKSQQFARQVAKESSSIITSADLKRYERDVE